MKNEEGLWALEVPVGTYQRDVIQARGEPQAYHTWKIYKDGGAQVQGEIMHYDDLPQGTQRSAAYEIGPFFRDAFGIERENMGSWDLYFDRYRRLSKVTSAEPEPNHLAEIEPRGSAAEWKRKIKESLNYLEDVVPANPNHFDPDQYSSAFLNLSEILENMPNVLPDYANDGLKHLVDLCYAKRSSLPKEDREAYKATRQCIKDQIAEMEKRLQLNYPIALTPGYYTTAVCKDKATHR